MRPKCIVFYKDYVKADGTPKPGRQCGYKALPGLLHCKLHHGIALGAAAPKSEEHMEKLNAGRDKWRARLQKAREQGIAVEMPGFKKGNKLATKKYRNTIKDKPPPVVDAIPRPKVMVQARELILSERAKLPALPDKPFEDMEPHEKLTSLMGTSLDIAAKVLSMPLEPEETPTTFKAQMKLVSDVWSVGVKVDRNTLTAKKQDKMLEIIARLKGETIEG